MKTKKQIKKIKKIFTKAITENFGGHSITFNIGKDYHDIKLNWNNLEILYWRVVGKAKNFELVSKTVRETIEEYKEKYKKEYGIEYGQHKVKKCKQCNKEEEMLPQHNYCSKCWDEAIEKAIYREFLGDEHNE